MKSALVFTAATQLLGACALGTAEKPASMVMDFDGQLDKKAQDIVTWDDLSLSINGERVMIFSGEVHPFRLPVPSLWIDVFQKIKALGFNCVSFYVDWALLEGKPGEYVEEGVFDLKPFFEAAKEAGLYLLARPGPYINAEVSGGGFPGWLSRVKGALRTRAPTYLEATENYMSHINAQIAEYQITNGGPVILYQPENEYTWSNDYMPFPDGEYMQYVIDQAKDQGIVVPIISNDASPDGHNAPGTGLGEVEIYGHDSYPLGFDCAKPTVWPEDGLQTTYWADHVQQSPNTPYSIVEFQGGSFDPWGGWGFQQCSELVNFEFERVFYKNNYASGIKLMNLYMIFGGTNWGNLGHPGGYTSYDYGAVIKEDRTVTREKYSELKLQATFLMSSPQYLLTTPEANTTKKYSDNKDIFVTALTSNDTESAMFFVVRHSNYSSLASTSYKLTLPTSEGEISVPVTNKSLSLNGRDSKMMAVNYDVSGTKLLYSTADIFTHQKFEDRTVLIMYAGPNEYNEFAIQGSRSQVKALQKGGSYTVQDGDSDYVTVGWNASPDRTILRIGEVDVYMLDRNSAYNYWLTPTGDKSKIIVNGPYLVRTANVTDGAVQMQADFNKTTTVEVIGAPSGTSKLLINGQQFDLTNSSTAMTAKVSLEEPQISIPTLSELDWKYTDSLPEIQADYDDSDWPVEDNTYTNNTYQLLSTPVSLYGSDYGYNAGMLVYRGHFNATGYENKLALWTQGGSGFAHSIWLDDQFIASYAGNGSAEYNQSMYALNTTLEAGSAHVFTVLVDQLGHNEESIGEDDMKAPRGILGWNLQTSKASSTPVTWKFTGNIGGEDYLDRARGPLNEGGLFAERQGYHLPAPPSGGWKAGSPLDGVDAPGVAFYSAAFNLSLPSAEWDVPLAFSFKNDSAAAGGAYRAQLWVNGWQFGKLSSSIGPQTEFPVPEGILDYGGENWVAVSLWALEEAGAKVPALEMTMGTPVWTGRPKVEVVDSPRWVQRQDAY
ncbi:glycoside hydrolase family 35 protein [Xylariomycetidae sp. FL0641]|nr:glycoside hydrolase family 35 protein [Xylariomycetidae sp. FL0641]